MDQLEYAQYCAAMYCNLSALFGDAPSSEELGKLIRAAVTAMRDDAELSDYEKRFYGYLANLAGRDLEELRRDVASEYAELFIGPRPPLAPYYESIYLGYPNRLFTNQTMDVQEFYEECGFKVIKSGRVPGDNIAYELELMALLAGREVDLLESEFGNEPKTLAVVEPDAPKDLALTREKQTTFINKHIGAWIGLLAARIAEAPCADFYGEVSRFATVFIEEDKQHRADMATSPKS